MRCELGFTNELEEQTISEAYTNTLDEMLTDDKNVMSIDADLMNAIGVQNIKNKHPDRVLDVGVAEANMMGIAAGLARIGKKPYVHTFGCFATRRAFDQIYLSGAYGRNPIRIFGSDPGVCAAYNGGTHMPFEDIAIMRTVPGATIIDIADTTMMKDIVKKAKDANGIFYFRACRSNVKKIYTEGAEFEIGKGNVLRDGSDVTIITNGILIAESLNAAAKLEQEGISAAVIDMFTIKPIDEELIIEYAKKTGALVVTDNHNTNGGLGDAVASVLCERFPTPMKKAAVFDEFGEVGSRGYLLKRFGLDESGIVQKVGEVLEMKRSTKL